MKKALKEDILKAMAIGPLPEFTKRLDEVLDKHIIQPNPKMAQIWKHKKERSDKTVKALPWFDIPDAVLEFDKKEAKEMFNFDKEQEVKIGCLVQIGWLLENDENIFIGVGLQARDEFEDVTGVEDVAKD